MKVEEREENVVCDVCYAAGLVAEGRKWWQLRRPRIAKEMFPAANLGIVVYRLSGKSPGGSGSSTYATMFMCSRHYRMMLKLLDAMADKTVSDVARILKSCQPDENLCA